MTKRISLSTTSVKPLKIERSFQLAKEIGYTGVEVMITPEKNSHDIEYIKYLMDKYEIPVTSIHAPTLLACKYVWGTSNESKLIKSIEMAEAVGAKNIIIHPPVKYNAYANRFIGTINRLQKSTKVLLSVENMFPWQIRGHKIDMYAPTWDAICQSVDNLVFDFSHASLSGLDGVEFVKQYGSKLKVIHLTDGTLRAKSKGDAIFDEHLIPGEGSMPIQAVYDELVKQGWKGKTVLEINTTKLKTLEEKRIPLQKSFDFYQGLFLPKTSD